MEDLAVLLGNFRRHLKEEISHYYSNFYSYLFDLFRERKINLARYLSESQEIEFNKEIERILDVIKIAFMTLGIAKHKVNKEFSFIKIDPDHVKREHVNYLELIEQEMKLTIDTMLLKILIEYLLNIDETKFQNLYLFDIIARDFILQIDKFKREFISSTQMKDENYDRLANLDKYINISDFSMDFNLAEIYNQEIAEINDVIEQANIKSEEKGTISEDHSRKNLKSDKKIELEPEKQVDFNRSEPAITKSAINMFLQKSSDTKKKEQPVQETPRSFLDFYGNSIPIKDEMTNKLKINRDNLINVQNFKHSLFDLRNLFHYVSILKMLNIKIPLKENEIIEILKRLIKKQVFVASSEAEPDPINVFYGLAIISELSSNISNQDNLISIYEIKMFIESELKEFNPKKLHLNTHTLLCLKILNQKGALMAIKNRILNPILDLDITTDLKVFNPILDIFEYFVILKLLDEKVNLNQFKKYKKELKKLLNENQILQLDITSSARLLLIIDLLDIKELEYASCRKLLNHIISKARFFDSTDLTMIFNWKENYHTFTIELRMLFHALLALSQFSDLIS
ncbi:MAG: hypothetical protein EU539_02940 [Promethearchaeota archaeon]|nr:MAG: hypothetical protein EU539_02940 [Candidatus Lokiarchaeota archaeon]